MLIFLSNLLTSNGVSFVSFRLRTPNSAANHTDGQIRCAEFKSRHWFHLPIENTKVGMYDSDHHFNILRERVDLMDLLSLSSVSWADKSIMTMVSNWIWGEPLQPPVIQSQFATLRLWTCSWFG